MNTRHMTLVVPCLCHRMAARPPEGHPTDFRPDAKGATMLSRFASVARTPFASASARTPFASIA
jgi:hypothetical protein